MLRAAARWLEATCHALGQRNAFVCSVADATVRAFTSTFLGDWGVGEWDRWRPETKAQGMHQTASQTEKPKRTESFGRKLENTIIQRGTVAQTGNKWKCTVRKCLKKANQFTTTNEKPLTFA